MSELPPTVAATWSPRTEAWLRQAPSEFAGAPNRPVFIGACPRSGTTLLRSMLDNHPDMAIPHETDFVRPLWWQRRAFGDLRDPANRRRVAEWIFSGSERRGYRLRVKKISKQDAVDRIAEAGPTIGSIIQASFELYADLHEKPRWGDKRPAYSGFMRQLFEMFPDAQYINLVRDPRGTVASQALMPWDEPDVAVPAAIARWEAAISRTDTFAAQLRPDQLLDVRYEDMVSEPYREVERICAFAGLRAGDALELMISDEHRERVRGALHQRTAEPVNTVSVERWRERLTPEQVVLVEGATVDLRERFGYPAAGDISAEPTPADTRELARQRRKFRRLWRRSRGGDVLRKALYRRPVTAERNHP